MKTKIITMLAVIMLVPVSQVHAVLDIYSNTVIQEGDYYDTLVNVYDTPPDHTTVDMTGGFVHNLKSFDSSTVNMTGGEILTLDAYKTSTANVSGGYVHYVHAWAHSLVNFSGDATGATIGASDSGTLNMIGGTTQRLGASYSGTLNIYGGMISEFLGASRLATVNIYGYDFNYDLTGGALDGGQLTGFWLEGTAFTIDLYGTETYSHINFIPEPTSLVLLILGALLLKRKR